MIPKIFLLVFLSICSVSFGFAQTSKEKVKCQICKGSGNRELIDSCNTCHGKGKVTVICKTCKGKGSVSCSACAGAGVLKHSSNFGDTFQDCKMCRGKGYILCQTCGGSKKQNVFCESCHGRGFLKRTVPCDHKPTP